MNAARSVRIASSCLVALLAGLPQSVLACSACFGKSDSALAQGMNAGILALLAVVVFVLSGFAAFFIYLAKRSSAITPLPDSGTVSTQEIVAVHE